MRERAPLVGGFRLRRVVGFLIVCGLVFVVRLLDLQVIQAAELNKTSYDKRSVEAVVYAPRGRILDSTGKVLAETVYHYDVNVDPTIIAPFTRKVNNQTTEISVEQARNELAELLDVDSAELATKFQGTSRYANLKKSVSPAVYRKIKQLDIPWVFYDPIPHRVYPNGAVAGNLLGFVGKDGEPLEGLELSMNACLAGQNGLESYERGVDGIKIPASTQVLKPAVNGNDLVLTINSDLQYYAQQVMTKYVRKQKAEWGSAVVIEVKTGKILAAAEAPTVDPNEYWKSSASDRGSRIFRALFEPGSTLKTVTAATAVDAGEATPTTQVVAPYSLKVLGNLKIQDSHSHSPVRLTLTGVLRDSSNTGIVQLGGKVSAQERYEYLKKFGLGQVTGANFAGEEKGILHNPKEIDGYTNLVTMFGQGISVTPIQTAMLYQTVANQGVRLSPQLVAGCQSDSGLVAPPLKAPVRVLSESAARSTVDMLEKVVEQGPIGRTARIAGYRVAGKTGTAQISNDAGTGYLKRYAISFIGMVPAENPQYVLAVTIFKPKTVSNSIGATPPWVAIMQQVLHEYRIPPSTTKSKNIPTEW